MPQASIALLRHGMPRFIRASPRGDGRHLDATAALEAYDRARFSIIITWAGKVVPPGLRIIVNEPLSWLNSCSDNVTA
jgi:hypothetical protein